MKARVVFLAVGVFAALSGCNRADHLGRPPSMSAPQSTPEFEAMISPELNLPETPQRPEASASLWAGQRNSLVRDRRAATRGDILTVVIEIDDRAEISNSSNRSRSAADEVSIADFGGIPQRLDKRLPDGASSAGLVNADASSSYKGSGKISRRDKLTLRVAATIINRLPNGTLHVQGSQEVRVNFEMRELTVSGFVRPEDIGRNNEIAYDRIAGARISYGGRGQITDVQQPRYGQQVADILLPY
ncbi:flagellar basal body L-ring protein FlgH [Paracoccus sp. SCSIO 75233]|uniref:flagellar basal body L-ring protein FlgH n=1 Tax=Paracoccus sp. SCSIO 75233 TaxID=3017782 RepID=UPI0022F057CD|nr:flagellar basal body L-ring protein FlgH [Paracoccus sp. SCSIO 75233]WBU53456.1 flagellar basal body L-ring protein FlgH [Paracoccus sp. SCSIO 75233]